VDQARARHRPALGTEAIRGEWKTAWEMLRQIGMRTILRESAIWTRRLILAIAVLALVTLALVLGIIAWLELFGTRKVDQLAFLPAIASPICALLAWAAGWLLLDDFRRRRAVSAVDDEPGALQGAPLG